MHDMVELGIGIDIDIHIGLNNFETDPFGLMIERQITLCNAFDLTLMIS